MRFSEIFSTKPFVLSFELFPPKTEQGDNALFGHVAELCKFDPAFITCTYGAGGSTRDKTLDIVAQVRRRFGRPVASHLTCVAATVDQLRAYLREAAAHGVDNIVALRGDPPANAKQFTATEGGLSYANLLVALIKAEFPQFGIAVAGYPETHQEAPSAEADLENLQRKVDAGADVVITQLFYDNADFFRFRERVEAAGIAVPLIPGILPVTSFSQIQRITSLCGARLPQEFIDSLARHDDGSPEQFDAGVAFATRQVAELIDAGVPGIHFYVLNKSQATAAVLRAVDRPPSE
jgi:methylenetetrahydrofolate reductase (NADPH)